MPDQQSPTAGWPPPGYPPPGTGWPPPGYPPPYAYPGYPQVPGKPATSGGRIVGVVAAAFVVLVLLVCGCLCAGGLWLDPTNSDPIAEDPWVVPDDDGWTEPTTGPIIPGRPTTRPSTAPPTPSKKPITRPTSGPAPVTVVYELSGSGVVDLAYFDAESDLIHVDGQKLPWRTTIRTNGKTRVMVEARWADDEGERPLDCTVTVTGAGKPVVNKTRGYWSTSCGPE
ncbi:MmpS family transport accessory protein [Micromonospora saelicesensis]|uniref:Membrane protein n=1 Tax=Micromonospora saelicesensis TaxID=285676 RepID=A0A1C4YBI8_9ACTN|nr:MmpS family transport accessory protein [Micromonospora saelicesensis]SCF18122.1 membrane protein [Micromonospora saelicesensis]